MASLFPTHPYGPGGRQSVVVPSEQETRLTGAERYEDRSIDDKFRLRGPSFRDELIR